MTTWNIIVLGIIQGLAELLPVSSSAHVILAEKFMGLDPSLPQMTFLLVMLHTGTMFSVLLFFWKRWLKRLQGPGARQFFENIVIASAVTGVLGFGLKHIIEKTLGFGEVENLFRILPLLAAALSASGLIILYSGLRKPKTISTAKRIDAGWIGVAQGLALPLRGLSRSGVTISTALLRNLDMRWAEEFSFALAVVLTPAAILHELMRFMKSNSEQSLSLASQMGPGLIGMAVAFVAGLAGLKWLSSWLESGKWKFFGIYCLALAGLVLALWHFESI